MALFIKQKRRVLRGFYFVPDFPQPTPLQTGVCKGVEEGAGFGKRKILMRKAV